MADEVVNSKKKKNQAFEANVKLELKRKPTRTKIRITCIAT